MKDVFGNKQDFGKMTMSKALVSPSVRDKPMRLGKKVRKATETNQNMWKAPSGLFGPAKTR